MKKYQKIPEWPQIRRRYSDFWKGTWPADRLLMQVQNLDKVPAVAPAWMADKAFLEKKYRNPDLFFKLIDYRRSLWQWHGDLFHYRIPSYAPNSLPLYLGSRVYFGTSVWQEPLLKSIEESDKINFESSNTFWQEHLETVDYFIEKCQGIELLGMTDFGGPMDWLGCFLGPEQLCLDVRSHPEKVQSFANRLGEIFCQLWDIVYGKISSHFDGSCNWLPMWAEGRLAVLQDDLAILLSPEIYRDVFGPVIRKIARHFEKVLFHFHSGALHQLDNLISIPEIEVIHFGIDPNAYPITSYLPHLSRIQAAGKGLFISVLAPADVPALIKGLDPRRMLLLVTAPDEESSRKLLEDSVIWTQRRVNQMAEEKQDA
ncbi:MAG: hypothetical protein NC911_06125 [Candidatus Omnitrophica bacterium]|nr:hypothetical protein [Candidatus Omnitrophota bacterium]